MTFFFSPDSLRTQVEAASGGRNTVIYDDAGNPTYCYIAPKFRYEDVGYDVQLGTGLVTAFQGPSGREIPELFVAQYPAKVFYGRAVSLPRLAPETSLDFDAAKAACTAKGPGWHLMTMHEWAAVILGSMSAGWEPRGNSSRGASHSNSEWGARVDRFQPGDPIGNAVTLAGSGPATWRHDATLHGIADLVGNVYEWLDGLKLVDGQVFCNPTNDFTALETSWAAQVAYFDSPVAGDDLGNDNLGAPVLDTAVTLYAGTQGTDTLFDSNQRDDWFNTVKAAGYSSIQLLQRLFIEPAGINPAGELSVRNYGTRYPTRGGMFTSGLKSGLGALSLTVPKTTANTGSLGFRPVFIP